MIKSFRIGLEKLDIQPPNRQESAQSPGPEKHGDKGGEEEGGDEDHELDADPEEGEEQGRAKGEEEGEEGETGEYEEGNGAKESLCDEGGLEERGVKISIVTYVRRVWRGMTYEEYGASVGERLNIVVCFLAGGGREVVIEGAVGVGVCAVGGVGDGFFDVGHCSS